MVNENSKVDLLKLSAVPGVGPHKMRALIGHFRSATEVFAASRSDLTGVTGIDKKTAESICNFDGLALAESQLQKAEKCGAQLISFWDKEYPALLKQIYDPPVILFIRGFFQEKDSNSIAVVGTRKPSSYGKLVADKLVSELSRKGLTIVSGLAYGIDTIAHESALNSGGRTMAVVGTGLDIVYPSQNMKLFDKIIQNGSVISEFPFGTGPDRQNFPRRNRIICGLSHGILVIEAGIKSGALITAAIALEQNREVFAVPGNITSSQSVGTNELIKQGAQVVTCAEDIIEELSVKLTSIFKSQTADVSTLNLTEAEKNIIRVLSSEPKHIDTIAQEANQLTSQVLSTLLTLELKSQVKQLAGKMFVRT